MDHVIWHDLECGGYGAELPLWREPAAAEGGPVLDVGAGTGRVALDLARRGVEVHALDLDRALDAAIAGGDGPLYAIPTYTAMLELRERLVRRGAAESSWTR